MNKIRHRIFEIIEVGKETDKTSKIYDFTMMICIVASIIPMCFKDSNPVFVSIEQITVIIFIVDYLFRLMTADFKLKKGGFSFLRYPFTFMAIIDFVSILPSLTSLSKGLKVLKILRLGRTLKVFRALKAFKTFKFFRYSKNVEIIMTVLRNQKDLLITVCFFAVGYVFIVALVMFNVEPDTFNSFFDALYWATISLTSVGYGDIYAVSTLGKVITMVSAVLGIAIIALPSGIITAGYMDEINKKNKKIEM